MTFREHLVSQPQCDPGGFWTSCLMKQNPVNCLLLPSTPRPEPPSLSFLHARHSLCLWAPATYHSRAALKLPFAAERQFWIPPPLNEQGNKEQL